MNSINLHQPGEVNEDVLYPSEWNELTAEELLCYAKHLLSGAYETKATLHAAIFFDILKLRTVELQKKLPDGWLTLLNMESVAECVEPAISFLFEYNTLTAQPFPVITLPGLIPKVMTGPTDAFDSLVNGELEVTEVEFAKFIAEPEHMSLASLAAIMWRPKGIPFMRYDLKKNSYVTYDWQKRAKDFALLPAEVLYCIYTWYSGCRHMLSVLFPLVYSSKASDAPEAMTETENIDLLAFTKCIHSGAGVKNGSRADIRTTLVKEFFFEMQQEAEKAKDLEREYKKYS